MNPKRISIPAVRLSDGEIISGDHHTILTLKAIRMGYKGTLVSGNLNYEGKFYPMYPIDEELIPKLKSENDAIKFAEKCSKGERDACKRLSSGDDLLKAVVTRWDSLRRLPMVVGAKRLDNNYIYTDGIAHGNFVTRHPDITFVKSAAHWKQLAIAGFLHDDGRFLTREQAASVCMKLSAFPINKDKLISGEEWVPPLKNEGDAKDFGKRMHIKGRDQVSNKINIFKYLKKNLEYVKLLEVALNSYESSTR